MKRTSTCALIGAVAVLAIGQNDLHAQDPLDLELDASAAFGEEWGLVFTPYMFLASQSIDLGSQEIRQSFNDLATLTDFAFQGRLTARYKRLLFSADGTYANLSTDQTIGRMTINGEVEQRILDMKFYWPVFDSRTPERTGGVGVWVGAGARYWSTAILLDIRTEPILPSGQPSQDTVDSFEDWWDPELGLALHFPVTPAVGFSMRATGGGFGVGNASDLMWETEFTALFRVSRRFLVSAGYKQYRYTRTEGEGDEEIETKEWMVGPWLGFSFGIF